MAVAQRKLIPGETLYRSAEVTSVNAETREVDFVFTTGHRGKRSNFWGDEWFEELAVDEQSIRLARFRSGGAPFLKNHGWRPEGYRMPMIEDQLGVIVRAWVEDGKGLIRVRFSERPDVEPFYQDVKAGNLRNVSVGYNVYKWEDVTPDDESIKIYRASDWEPVECSLVPIQFDPGTMSRSGAAPGGAAPWQAEVIFNRSAAGGDHERGSDTMTVKNEGGQQGGTTTNPVDLEQVRAEAAQAATQAERTRVSEIQKLVRSVKLDDAVATKLVAEGKSVEDARAAIIEAVAQRDEKVPTTNHQRIVAGDQDENKTRSEALGHALMLRADPSLKLAEREMEIAKEFRGMTLAEAARHFLNLQGVSTRGMSKSQVASEALRVRGFHSTGDFPHILGNTTGRSLLAGYDKALTLQTFRPFTRPGFAPDFKQVARVTMGEVPTLEKVPQGATVTYGTIGEAKEVVSLATYARIFAITREVIINDDLGAFTDIPRKFGMAAARLESDIVWAVITGNPTMGDNNALFSAAHANQLASGGAAPDVAGLKDARQKMRKQKGIGERDFLMIEPKFLLVPVELETEAEQLVNPNMLPTQVSNINPFSQKVTPIAEARLSANSATKWYMAADPAQGWDVMELLYLDGASGPQVEQEVGFDVNGVKVKALHDVAAKALDWRTFYYNKGAA